jgi:hypothetical protein
MFDLFAVKTAHGTQLQVDSGTGQIWSGRNGASDTLRPLVLFVPKAAPAAGFLVSPEGLPTRLFIGGDTPTGRLMPLRLQRERNAATASLCHPFTGRYMCALPAAEGRGDLIIDRVEKGGWEMFTLLKLHVPTLPPSIATMLDALERWFARTLSGPAALYILQEGLDPAMADAFDAYGRLLLPDQIAWLAPTLVANGPAVAQMARAFPHDPFAQDALPALQSWLSFRPPLTSLTIGPERDGLAELGIDGEYASFAHICTTHARRSTPSRKTIALLATARNEGLYLLEWIAYHQSIGVEAFFIYSNDNSDGSDALLASLVEAGVISWIHSELDVGHAAQPKAYGHALSMLPHILDYRWTLIIDLDEFFAFDAGRFASIQDYIAWQETRPVDAIALNWLVFGSGGDETWRDIPMVARFTQRLPWVDKHIKTMVRTNLVMHSRPHHPITDARQRLTIRNAAGALHVDDKDPSFSAQPESTTAWINHYFLKSAEEFVWKFSRNRGDHALVRQATPMSIEPNFAEMFVQQHGSDTLVSDDRILACAGGVADHITRLMSLPGVADALRGVQRHYALEMTRLKALMCETPAFSAPGSAHQALTRMLGG